MSWTRCFHTHDKLWCWLLWVRFLVSRFFELLTTSLVKDIHTPSSLRRTCMVRSIIPNHLFRNISDFTSYLVQPLYLRQTLLTLLEASCTVTKYFVLVQVGMRLTSWRWEYLHLWYNYIDLNVKWWLVKDFLGRPPDSKAFLEEFFGTKYTYPSSLTGGY